MLFYKTSGSTIQLIDVDECTEKTACPSTVHCQNMPGAFICQCSAADLFALSGGFVDFSIISDQYYQSQSQN